MQRLPATYRADMPLKAVRQRVAVVDGGLRAVCEVQGVPLSMWSQGEVEGSTAAILDAYDQLTWFCAEHLRHTTGSGAVFVDPA